MKRCNRCDTTKPLGEFASNGYCRPCHATYVRAWYARERVNNPDARRSKMLRHYFKITLEEWEALFDSQGRVCAACGADEHRGVNWHTDHDHTCCPGARSCGRCVKGILCTRCNVTLGQVDDNIATLFQLADYLAATRNEGGAVPPSKITTPIIIPNAKAYEAYSPSPANHAENAPLGEKD